MGNFEYSSDVDFDSKQILEYFQSPLRKEQSREIISKIKDFQEVEFHRSVAKRQRNSYNEKLSDKELLKKWILIDFDFMEKLIVGIGPREISSSFFKRTQVSLLGFGIYFTDENEEIQCINVDFVTDNTTQDGLRVVNNFKFLRKQKFFKNLKNNKNLILFCDSGSHFKNKVRKTYVYDYLNLSLYNKFITFFYIRS